MKSFVRLLKCRFGNLEIFSNSMPGLNIHSAFQTEGIFKSPNFQITKSDIFKLMIILIPSF